MFSRNLGICRGGSLSSILKSKSSLGANIPGLINMMTNSIGNRYSSSQDTPLTQEFATVEEKNVFTKLLKAFAPKELAVHDISGGCGSMYQIDIKSDKFNPLTTIKQHKMVNAILKEEISQWHGLQLSTKKDK